MAAAYAINSPRAANDKVELEVGVPRVLKLMYDKPRETRFSLMFTTDQGPLFVPTADGEASEFEHQIAELNVGRGDSIRVTKVKHGGRGGGFNYRVERTGSGAATDRDYSAELEKSIQRIKKPASGAARQLTWDESQALGLTDGPEPYWADADSSAAPARTTNDSPSGNGSAHPQAGPMSPTSLRFMGAYKDAVDVLLETQRYAKAQGLLLEIRCEDVRCLAATVMIQAGGR